MSSPGSRGGSSSRSAFIRGNAQPLITQIVLQANSSIANSTFNPQSWSAADILRDDVNSWTATAPTKFTLGLGLSGFKLTGFAAWASNVAGARWLYANLNTVQTCWGSMHTAAAANENFTPVTGRSQLAAPGSVLEFIFAQSSGGALNLTGSATPNAVASWIEIQWLV